MGRSILKDIDLETMYSMRREGMNNAEIANALGVSRATVINLIGPQPKELNKKEAVIIRTKLSANPLKKNTKPVL